MSNTGTSEFLNFSDALNHLRWGERIARRGWTSHYVKAVYRGVTPGLQLYSKRGGSIASELQGTDLMAEDWYVLGAHQ